jgi:UPF0755 protein
MKKNLKIIIALILLLIMLIIRNLINMQISLEHKEFVIKQGDEFLLIADNLKKDGIIKDKNIFIVFAYLNGDYAKIKPGEYIFDGKYNLKQIISILKSNLGISVTIPECFNIFQIENELIEKGIIKNKFELVDYKISNLKFNKYPFLRYVDSNNNLEGFLYPNTYYFLENTSIDQIVSVFLDNFNKEIYSKIKNEVGEKDIYTKLILASLLEKEIYHKEDIPNALSVIQNRINNNMLLQIDATLCYIKMSNNYLNGDSVECGVLTNVDKKLNSLYNTYMNKDMIPTPICNVNFETLDKIFKNVETKYFYYITDPKTKDAIFSKTLEEHNINVSKYLK